MCQLSDWLSKPKKDHKTVEAIKYSMIGEFSWFPNIHV